MPFKNNGLRWRRLDVRPISSATRFIQTSEMFSENEGVAARVPHSVPQIESEHFGLLYGF
jgi:hypothetical protein